MNLGDIKNIKTRSIIYNDIEIKIPNNLRKEILNTISYAEVKYGILLNDEGTIFKFLYLCLDKDANTGTLGNTLPRVYKTLKLTEMQEILKGGKKIS